MEQLICALFAEGQSDATIAARLTALGHRSPSSQTVLPNTVRCLRLKQRLFQKRSQSHPRRIAGFLTVSQIARALTVPVHWIYDHIKRGTLAITKDPTTRLYLFPDQPQTLKKLKELKDGTRRHIQFHDSPSSSSKWPDMAGQDNL
jgi:hypothetical protein